MSREVLPGIRQFDLKGKTAVITGGSKGLGLAMAAGLASAGASVMLVNRNTEAGIRAAQELSEDFGVRAISYGADITVREQAEAMAKVAIDAFGHIDILINNAGLGGEAAIVEMTDEQWSRVIDVTLTSLFRMTRAFLPAMYAARAGVMVNNASVLGWRAQKGQAHYAAAKAGVMAFTRCAALEAAEHNVRINAVAPSLAMHPFLARATTPETLARLVEKEAFGRPAEVWEVANVMLFLASDLSSYMTGEIVSVSSQRA